LRKRTRLEGEGGEMNEYYGEVKKRRKAERKRKRERGNG
jgi:hypothetical protein